MSIQNNKMDGKSKHPFAIICRKCGSNHVRAIAFDYHSLEIRCMSCGNCVDCGYYDTQEGDYSGEDY